MWGLKSEIDVMVMNAIKYWGNGWVGCKISGKIKALGHTSRTINWRWLIQEKMSEKKHWWSTGQYTAHTVHNTDYKHIDTDKILLIWNLTFREIVIYLGVSLCYHGQSTA